MAPLQLQRLDPKPSLARVVAERFSGCMLPTWPNPTFERTAASALRLLAVPSSLRSSAAAQRERWAAKSAHEDSK